VSGSHLIADCRLQIADCVLEKTQSQFVTAKTKDQRPKTEKGFTLLELMIVLFVITILAAVALPMYQRSVLKSKETVLKDNLHTMRRMIDQYAADKGRLPQTLDDLVSEGYLREVPYDPIADTNEWELIRDKDVNSVNDETGVVDVKSKSQETGTDKKPYNEY